MAAKIFVVSGDDGHRLRLINVLSGAGYRASGAATFAEAKQVLGSSSADLVIAEERLGAFNGLHVIVLGRAHRPDLKAIVMTAHRDPALETDARRLNVDCVVETANAAEWLESVSRTLDETPALDETWDCVSSTIH
jgi:DNA-binding NtrC family response regulator